MGQFILWKLAFFAAESDLQVELEKGHVRNWSPIRFDRWRSYHLHRPLVGGVPADEVLPPAWV